VTWARWCARAGFAKTCFYRLHVLPVRVPPLRERRSDIPALVEVLGEDLALRNGTAPPELQADAMALLAGQPWRGNIRELRNVLEQAAMRSDSQPSMPTNCARSCAKPGWSLRHLCPMPCQSPGRWATSATCVPWPSRWPNWSSAP
jgi:DNA-binding NtrC family response regulator